eukprot:IDg17586t1
MSARALTLRPRSSAAALLAAYALFRALPSLTRLLRAARRTLAAADDATAVAAALAKDLRALVLDRAPAAPRALRRVLRALAAPDALRILRHVAAAAAAAAVRAARPPPPLVVAETQGRSDTVALVDGALRALDSPHGRRVTATVVAAAAREAAMALAAPHPRRKAAACAGAQAQPLRGESDIADQVMEVATSEKGKALLLDALAVAVRAAVPAVLATQACAQETTRSCAPSQSAPSVDTSASAPIDASAASDTSAQTPLERVAARVLHDQSLIRDLVRTAAAEAVRAYLT